MGGNECGSLCIRQEIDVIQFNIRAHATICDGSCVPTKAFQSNFQQIEQSLNIEGELFQSSIFNMCSYVKTYHRYTADRL